MNIKTGTLVKITDNPKEKHFSPGWSEEMNVYMGEVATVTGHYSKNQIKLDIDNGQWMWGKRWLTPYIEKDQDELFRMLVEGEISEETYIKMTKER